VFPALRKQQIKMENVKIVKLTFEDVEKVYKYMVEEFVPDEPVMSSFEILQNIDCLSNTLNKDWKKELVVKPIESGHSFGAFNDEGDLLGIKLGNVLTKESIERPPPNMNWILSLPNVLVPKSLQLAIYCGKFFEWMSYGDFNLAFDQCEGNNGRIFENLILGNIHFILHETLHVFIY